MGSVEVEPTGGWQDWTTVTADLDGVPEDGGSSLYFVIRRPSDSDSTSSLLNVNWIEFQGARIGEDTAVPARNHHWH